jgi:hypothetical protein
MDRQSSYRYPADSQDTGYLPAQGASSLFDPRTVRSGVSMSRRIPQQRSATLSEPTTDTNQPFGAVLPSRRQPVSGTGRRSSWTREITVPPRRIGSHLSNRATVITTMSETQPASTSLLKKAVEMSALIEGSPSKPKSSLSEIVRRGSLPGRRRSLMTKAQNIPSQGPSLLALYEQRSEELAELARTAQAIVLPQSNPRRRSRSLPSITQPTFNVLDARKRNLGITALRGFAWIPDVMSEEAGDYPTLVDEDRWVTTSHPGCKHILIGLAWRRHSFVSYTSESLITPSEDLSMANLQQSTSQASQVGQSSSKRPIFSDPFGRITNTMTPMYEEDEQLGQYPDSPIRTTSGSFEPRLSPTNRFAIVESRPVIHRYRTAPSAMPSSSGLNIMFDNLDDDPDSRQSFWIDRHDQEGRTESTHSTSPTSELKRTFSLVQMTRQTRRLSDSSAMMMDAPMIGSPEGARAGRFDSVVSWRSKRGSWAAISLVDDSFLGEAEENRWSDVLQSAALDAVILPEGGRTRFDSVDTAIRNHQANGGMWGGELPIVSSSSQRERRPESVPVNQVRRGTEGALPVYVDMGDQWVRL